MAEDYRSILLGNVGALTASVQEVSTRVREMEVTQAGEAGALKTKVEAHAAAIVDFEKRLRAVESVRSQALLLAAIAAIVVSALIKWGIR